MKPPEAFDAAVKGSLGVPAAPFAYAVTDGTTTVRFEAPTVDGLLDLITEVAPDALTVFEPRE